MFTQTKIITGTYRDSVSLMQVAAALGGLAGVDQASASMATAGNLDLLREVGLIDGAMDARPSDLLIVVRASSAAAAAAAIARAEDLLRNAGPVRAPEESNGVAGTGGDGAGTPSFVPRSIGMAVEAMPDASLALISVPGDYAAAEARKAIDLGLNVMLFSDNVSIEDELDLKRRAAQRGVLLMGPDCGTAIIDGVPLGFANRVRRGTIGCIGASGTGLQQVTTLVDSLGLGISQAIGTGGRDLKTEIGGRTMLAALRLLAADDETAVIVLISKPPAAAVADAVLAAAAQARKPVVVNFLGSGPEALRAKNLHPAHTLEDAARAAVSLALKRPPPARAPAVRGNDPPRLAAGQRYIRGLYSGGTFCYEAALLLGEQLGKVWSNTPLRDEDTLADPWHSREHSVVDLGDDVFTRGRPHPMIDHRMRNERMVREARDSGVAVILFDVVLGFGSHPDPAAEIVPAIRAARAAARAEKRQIAFVGFVCGTDADPQDRGRQEAALAEAGVTLAGSNAAAVRLAAALAGGPAANRTARAATTQSAKAAPKRAAKAAPKRAAKAASKRAAKLPARPTPKSAVKLPAKAASARTAKAGLQRTANAASRPLSKKAGKARGARS